MFFVFVLQMGNVEYLIFTSENHYLLTYSRFNRDILKEFMACYNAMLCFASSAPRNYDTNQHHTGC